MKLGRRLSARFGAAPTPVASEPDPGHELGPEPEPDEPCIPCGEGQVVRQFSLNPPAPRALGDGEVLDLAPGRQVAVVDGQVVLYDPIRSASHVLNPSAAAVWAAVDGRRTVVEVIDALEAETGVERARLDPDVRLALAGLLGAGILVADRRPALDADPELAARPAIAATATTPGADQARGAERGRAVSGRLLDQHRWPVVIGPVRAAGLDVLVRSDEATTAERLTSTLAALAPSPPGAPAPTVVSVREVGPGHVDRYRLYVGGRRHWRGRSTSDLVASVVSEITLLALARTPGHLLVHAGGVERGGQVVAIAGQSGRGKSTLTAALVQRGFAYLTDELLAVDPTTRSVLPYAKPLDLDPIACRQLDLVVDGERRAGKDRQPVPVAQLGAVSTGGTLVLVVLLDDEILDGEHAQAPPAVRDLLDLVGVTFGESFADEGALASLAGLAGSVPLLRLGRGPLDQMAAQVEAALDRVVGPEREGPGVSSSSSG